MLYIKGIDGSNAGIGTITKKRKDEAGNDGIWWYRPVWALKINGSEWYRLEVNKKLQYGKRKVVFNLNKPDGSLKSYLLDQNHASANNITGNLSDLIGNGYKWDRRRLGADYADSLAPNYDTYIYFQNDSFVIHYHSIPSYFISGNGYLLAPDEDAAKYSVLSLDNLMPGATGERLKMPGCCWNVQKQNSAIFEGVPLEFNGWSSVQGTPSYKDLFLQAYTNTTTSSGSYPGFYWNSDSNKSSLKLFTGNAENFPYNRNNIMPQLNLYAKWTMRIGYLNFYVNNPHAGEKGYSAKIKGKDVNGNAKLKNYFFCYSDTVSNFRDPSQKGLTSYREVVPICSGKKQYFLGWYDSGGWTEYFSQYGEPSQAFFNFCQNKYNFRDNKIIRLDLYGKWEDK